MEIAIIKSEFAKLLHVTLAIAEKKAQMPILANVVLTAEGNSFQVTSSDLEVTALASCPAIVKRRGSITVNAKVLGDLVRELPEGEVTIRVSERDRVEVLAGSSKLRIVGVSADEYPVPPGLAVSTACRLPAPVLSDMINKTLYAVSQDEGRINMSGLCLEVVKEEKEAGLRMVATDGHRLALVTRPMQTVQFSGLALKGTAAEGSALPDHVIVPRKGVAEVRKALEAAGDVPVGVNIAEGFLVVEGSGWKLVVRLLDGEFPNYSQVVPRNTGSKVTVLSSALAHALKRVSLVVSDKNKGVRFDLIGTMLRISSSSPELGEAQEEVDVQYSGPDFALGFNARYILDVLATVGENQPFVMELAPQGGPGKFYPEADESCFGIVMPLRLDS